MASLDYREFRPLSGNGAKIGLKLAHFRQNFASAFFCCFSLACSGPEKRNNRRTSCDQTPYPPLSAHQSIVVFFRKAIVVRFNEATHLIFLPFRRLSALCHLLRCFVTWMFSPFFDSAGQDPLFLGCPQSPSSSLMKFFRPSSPAFASLFRLCSIVSTMLVQQQGGATAPP